MPARKKSQGGKSAKVSPASPASGAAGGEESAEYSEEVKRYHAQYLKTLGTFDRPPAGFDPCKATDRELLRYGFPRRPHAEREHRLHALWQKAFSRPIKPITARLKIDEVLVHRYRRGRRVRDGRFAPGGWGGIIAQTSDFGFSPPEPANMVYGEWMVPSMAPDFDNPNTSMTVGFWVGLDGSLNNQVLQAGTAATVTGENISYWAWFEWFPDPPVRITNFPIEPGDVITTLVCAPQPTQGYMSMMNRQTGATTSVGIPPPPGISSVGTTAEWIVEGISADLPNWVIVGFHECTAGTKSHSIDISHPTVTEISGTTKDLTVAIAWAPNTVLVLWEGIR
jgi:hypothetical protein